MNYPKRGTLHVLVLHPFSIAAIEVEYFSVEATIARVDEGAQTGVVPALP